jgi:hypothetical protein
VPAITRAEVGDLASALTRLGTELKDGVSSIEALWVMLNNGERVTPVGKVSESSDEFLGVARVKTNRGFIENEVSRDKVTSKCRDEIYPLRLST